MGLFYANSSQKAAVSGLGTYWITWQWPLPKGHYGSRVGLLYANSSQKGAISRLGTLWITWQWPLPKGHNGSRVACKMQIQARRGPCIRFGDILDHLTVTTPRGPSWIAWRQTELHELLKSLSHVVWPFLLTCEQVVFYKRSHILFRGLLAKIGRYFSFRVSGGSGLPSETKIEPGRSLLFFSNDLSSKCRKRVMQRLLSWDSSASYFDQQKSLTKQN